MTKIITNPPDTSQYETELARCLLTEQDHDTLKELASKYHPEHVLDPDLRSLCTQVVQQINARGYADRTSLSCADSLVNRVLASPSTNTPPESILGAVERESSLYLLRQEVEKAFASCKDPSELSDAVGRIAESHRSRSYSTKSEAPSTLWSRIKARAKDLKAKGSALLGVATPWKALDRISYGLQAGHLWIWGGFTSVGKTQLAVEFVYNAIHALRRVIIISTEQSESQYLLRLVARETGVTTPEIQLGRGLDYKGQEKADAFIEKCESTGLRIYDKLRDVDSILTAIWREHKQRPVDLVVIDFVQNVTAPGESAYEQTRRVALELQLGAISLDIPVFALSQVSNESARGIKTGDYLLAFKGAGELAAAADVAVVLSRLDQEESEKEFGRPLDGINCSIQKHRHGPTGNFQLEFVNSYTALVPVPSAQDVAEERAKKADRIREEVETRKAAKEEEERLRNSQRARNEKRAGELFKSAVKDSKGGDK